MADLHMRCPRCHGFDVFYEPPLWHEYLLVVLLRRPYWCERCIRRYRHWLPWVDRFIQGGLDAASAVVFFFVSLFRSIQW